MIIQVKTPAKINLILEVLHKRSDGFHEIQSIMQAIDLCDVLTIEMKSLKTKENKIELSGNSDKIPYDETNLVYRAAEMFLQEAKKTGKEIKIHIEKNIPVSAGLAGGSSNAAGTLWGLNQICKKPLTPVQLHDIAANLGSDVSFCLEGGTQMAASRGEVLSKIYTPELKIVVIKPKKIFISAKEAYEKYSKLSKKPGSEGIEEMESAIYRDNLDKIPILIHNHLENAVLPDYPQLQAIKDYLTKKGCKNPLMSGSGPSVFGIYEDEIDLSDINSGWEYFLTNTINTGVSGKIIRRRPEH